MFCKIIATNMFVATCVCPTIQNMGLNDFCTKHKSEDVLRSCIMLWFLIVLFPLHLTLSLFSLSFLSLYSHGRIILLQPLLENPCFNQLWKVIKYIYSSTVLKSNYCTLLECFHFLLLYTSTPLQFRQNIVLINFITFI